MEQTFRAPSGIGGRLRPPADKSVTHRALMLAAVSSGDCSIANALETGDCLSTRRCLEALGARFTGSGGQLRVHGAGLRGLAEPSGVLDAENSGTTMRLLSGLLAGLPLLP